MEQDKSQASCLEVLSLLKYAKALQFAVLSYLRAVENKECFLLNILGDVLLIE